jgi:hypothetical protein
MVNNIFTYLTRLYIHLLAYSDHVPGGRIICRLPPERNVKRMHTHHNKEYKGVSSTANLFFRQRRLLPLMQQIDTTTKCIKNNNNPSHVYFHNLKLLLER